MRGFTTIVLFIFASLSWAQQDTALLKIEKGFLTSKELKETREYWVRLPKSYNTKISYPVIYILDAEWRFNIAQALEAELSENEDIPPHIIVGVPNTNRRLDLTFSTSKVNHKGSIDTIAFTASNTGNGKDFLAFLEQELIPEINKNYHSNGYHILVGHSLGGYFCSYILPKQHSFKSLQIYDPSIWYNNGEAINLANSDELKISNCKVYLSVSGNFDSKYNNHHQKIDSLHKVLMNNPTIEIQYKCYHQESHNSMFLYSFLDGMKMIYEGYNLQNKSRKPSTAGELEKYYADFSKRIGHQFLPPILEYREIGYQQFQQKKYKESILALEKYLQTEETDAFAIELIGDAYHFNGELGKAKKSYKKAHQLAPDNLRLKNKYLNSTSND